MINLCWNLSIEKFQDKKFLVQRDHFYEGMCSDYESNCASITTVLQAHQVHCGDSCIPDRLKDTRPQVHTIPPWLLTMVQLS